MNISKQFPLGVLIGILIGLTLFYAIAQNYQVGALQAQITDLENQITQLNENNNLTTPNPTSSPTPNLTPTTTPSATPTVSSSPVPTATLPIANEENLTYTTAYVTGGGNGPFEVTLNLKNLGTTTAIINPSETLYNGRADASYVTEGFNWTWTSGTSTINPSAQSSVTITIPRNASFSAGMTVEITLHTVSDGYYSKVVTMP